MTTTVLSPMSLDMVFESGIYSAGMSASGDVLTKIKVDKLNSHDTR